MYIKVSGHVLPRLNGKINKPVACKDSRKALIAIMSRLDAVVACINVLDPMEN